VFRAVLDAAVAQDSELLRVGIVTFSGQKDLIREVLEIMVGKDSASQIFIRSACRDWSVPASYVPLTNSSVTGKQPHIASILDEMFQETGEVLYPEQVLLIDDDAKNIKCAEKYRHKTVVFPPLPLPGIHMRSPAMEASGVRVIHRCQLANGALLCISHGSVVNFSAPGQSAIVNAANTGGLGGGGVDGAISKAGGSRLLAARKAWPQDARGDRIPTGECRSTGPGSFGKLQVSYVLHSAGPNYRLIEGLNKCQDDAEESLNVGDALLAASYTNSMRSAKDQGIELLGFSLISAGVFRGRRSLRAVLSIAVECVAREAYEGLREVHLVAFSQEEIAALLCLVTEAPPAALRRGAGGENQIRQFMDHFEKNTVS
jgi:O-acetyl-ADP-ribose deacetylase